MLQSDQFYVVSLWEKRSLPVDYSSERGQENNKDEDTKSESCNWSVTTDPGKLPL